MLTLSLLSALSASVATASEFSLIDYSDDSRYSVTLHNDLISIHSSDISTSFYADTGVISCSVYDGVFSFMSRVNNTNSGYMTSVYRYDIHSNDLEYYSFTHLSMYSDYAFTADKYGMFYFVNASKSSTVSCYTESGCKYTVNCQSPVRQLLCIDGEHVTAITANGIYTISDGKTEKLSSERPMFPCIYTGNGIVTDANGTIYSFDKGNLIPIQDNAQASDTLSDLDTDISSSHSDKNIKIKDDLIYVDVGTTVSVLRNTLGVSKDNFNVTGINGKEIKSGKLGTGAVVKVNNSEYRILIPGELTGEGNINSRDLKAMMKYITGEETPDKLHSLASDINSDKKTDTKDLLLLANKY